MSTENKQGLWFAVRLGPGLFEVNADCPPCAVETLGEHLQTQRNDGKTHQEALGVPDLGAPGVLLRVEEIDEARRAELNSNVVPQLGGEAVVMASYANSTFRRIQELRGI